MAFFNFAAIVLSAVVVNPVAAGASMIGALVLGVALRPISRLTKRLAREFSMSNREYSSRIAEMVRIAQEVRVLDVTKAVRSEMDGYVESSYRPFFRSRFVNRITPNLYYTVAMALVIVAMVVVWSLDTSNATELGVVVLLLLRALSYSQQLQSAIQQGAELAPYLDQVIDKYEAYQTQTSEHGSLALDRVSELAFDDVSFAYPSGPPVLRSVSFRIFSGECVGIIGPSGSGKSTLVQLLLRLRAPTTGCASVNGHSIQEYLEHDWRRQFAFVPQDNKLLRGTVADNIRFHRQASDDMIVEAARLAHLHDEIEAMTDGYGTLIGSGAADLSGGQRQRLGLARALLFEPAVVILDEPTSVLDMRSEALVQQSLVELHGQATLVIVAHRMSTLTICDRLMVVRHGEIEAFAPRAEIEVTNEFLREVMSLSRVPAPDVLGEPVDGGDVLGSSTGPG